MPKSTPLMWNIRHPKTGALHTLFVLMEDLPPNLITKYSQILSQNARFMEAKMLLIESGRYREEKKPEQPPGCIQILTRRPDFFSVLTTRSLNTTLVSIAQKMKIPTYGLESSTDRRIQWGKTVGETCLKPSNVLRWFGFMATGPIGYLAFALPHQRQIDRELRTFASMYDREDMEPALAKLKDNPKIHHHLGRDRTFSWAYEGANVDDPRVATSHRGLVDLLADENFTPESYGAFIQVSAAHVFGEQGLLEILQREGYECTPIEGWREPSVRNTVQVIPDDKAHRDELSIRYI